jgi:hypothetical protein
MLEWCDRDLDKDDMYRIEAILGHRKNPKTKKWELHLLWGSGKQTWNDFNLTLQDDPNELLSTTNVILAGEVPNKTIRAK